MVQDKRTIYQKIVVNWENATLYWKICKSVTFDTYIFPFSLFSLNFKRCISLLDYRVGRGHYNWWRHIFTQCWLLTTDVIIMLSSLCYKRFYACWLIIILLFIFVTMRFCNFLCNDRRTAIKVTPPRITTVLCQHRPSGPLAPTITYGHCEIRNFEININLLIS